MFIQIKIAKTAPPSSFLLLSRLRPADQRPIQTAAVLQPRQPALGLVGDKWFGRLFYFYWFLALCFCSPRRPLVVGLFILWYYVTKFIL